MNVYRCFFRGNYGPGKLYIYVQSERELTKSDIVQILNAAYVNKNLYETQQNIPELQAFMDAERVNPDDIKERHTLSIWDNIEHVLLSDKAENLFLLDIPVNMTTPQVTQAIVHQLKEIAKDWTYENKIPACAWAEFLSNASEEFLLKYGIRRQTTLPRQVKYHIKLQDEHLVETQNITVSFRDDNYTLTSSYKITLPTYVLTKCDLQDYLADVAKKCGYANHETTLHHLLNALSVNDKHMQNYGLSVEHIDINETFEFNLNTLARKD